MLIAIREFFVLHGYTLELLFAYSLFAVFFPRRRLWPVRLALSYAVLLAYSIFCDRFGILGYSIGPYMKYLGMYIIAGVGVLFCVEVTAFSALFVVTAASATQHIVYLICSIILSLTANGYDSFLAMFLNPTLVMVGYSFTFFMFYTRFKGASETLFESKRNVLVGVLLFLVTIVLHLIEESYNFREVSPSIYTLFATYDLVLCFLVLRTQYDNVVSRELLDDNETLEYLVGMRNEQYERLKENMDLINIKCHDMKQQISLYGNRMDSGAMDEIKNVINVYELSFKTGNEALDMLFAEKSLVLDDRGIQLDCIADGDSISFMAPADIYALFGNAIDNAIEAMKQVPEDKKVLTILVKKKINMVIIHFENYYTSDLSFEDGLPKTTKKDTNYHGFGMRSIRHIAQKYNGSITVDAKDGIFNLNILIPARD